ncbi:hypothetical protein OAU50_02485 [Planctomycetota bacterium]|nr:hypothetical protein [Planctomycetota bacterium]
MHSLGNRTTFRGGALAAALFFMIVVTTAGVALLNSSTSNQLAIIERSIDVRLMIAAEAGLESVRGRFRFVAGVQDDWSALVPSTSWTTIDTLTVNGIAVTVQTKNVTTDSVGKAQVRTIATGPSYSRVVQMTLRVPSFSDYAVFLAMTSKRNYATGFSFMGDYYTGGNVGIQNAPVFYGQSYIGGVVQGDAGGGGGPTDPISFPLVQAKENTPAVTMPPSSFGEGSLEAAANLTSTKLYKNTYKIELKGTYFTRHYHWKNSTTSGTATQDIAIPSNGVIYISADDCPVSWSVPGASPQDNSTGTLQTTDTKEFNEYWANANHPAWYSPPDVTNSNRVNLDLEGWLAKGIRVTIACEHQIRVTDNIVYETYAEDPTLRRRLNRQSTAAMDMTEMLGVYSREWLLIENNDTNSFRDMNNVMQSEIDSDGVGASTTTGIAVNSGPLFEQPDGTSHTPPSWPYNSNNSLVNTDASEQNCMDGAFMSGGYVLRSHRSYTNNKNWRTFWICGSFIANGLDGGGKSFPNLIRHHGPKNYNYDYRMKFTTPPYFLIAYNTSAKMVPGTWLSYTQ